VDVRGFLYCFFHFSDYLSRGSASTLSNSGDAQAISVGMLVPKRTSRLKLTLFLDDDYAHLKTIHVGLGFYSRFPEPEEADVVVRGSANTVFFCNSI
jgi:hypothetical protein